jgi:D-sedoheptulose 7-phosphate isomerase
MEETIKESIRVKSLILADQKLHGLIAEAAMRCIETFKQGGKVLFCGNGGSAADAQHLSAELSGRYNYDRPPLFAEALHVNSSYVTAVSNDYGFEHVYSRMTEAMGKKGDVLVGLSTSGNSPNVVAAFQKARELGIQTIAFTGADGGKLKSLADIAIQIPSDHTARIQESHILIGHILCDRIEKAMFPQV